MAICNLIYKSQLLSVYISSSSYVYIAIQWPVNYSQQKYTLENDANISELYVHSYLTIYLSQSLDTLHVLCWHLYLYS